MSKKNLKVVEEIVTNLSTKGNNILSWQSMVRSGTFYVKT